MSPSYLHNPRPNQWTASQGLCLPNYRRLWTGNMGCMLPWEGEGTDGQVWDHGLQFHFNIQNGTVGSPGRYATGILPQGNGFGRITQDTEHIWISRAGIQPRVRGLTTQDCTFGYVGVFGGSTDRDEGVIVHGTRSLRYDGTSDSETLHWITNTSPGNDLSHTVGATLKVDTKVIICRLTNGVEKSIWVDERKVASNTPASETFDVNGNYAIFYFGTTPDKSNMHLTAKSLMGAIWNRALSDDEIRLFARNPFGMVTPYWARMYNA